MSSSGRFKNFLSHHPRLVQLVTVTPVAEEDEDVDRDEEDLTEVSIEREVSGTEEGADKPRFRVSSHRELDEAFLVEVIRIIQTHADHSENASRRRRLKREDEQEAVEAIRALAEIVVWGDQNNTSLWDIFMSGEAMRHLSRIVRHSSFARVRRQCLQSLSIMVQSFQHETSLYNLFSRNYINEILSFDYDLDDQEIVGHLVSIIRGITNKINSNVLQFFFDADAESFPLYDKATQLFDHREAMFRIAVRNATLSVYSLNDQQVLDYVTKGANEKQHYFNRIFAYVNSIEDIVRRAFIKAAASDLQRGQLQAIDDHIAEMEGTLEYVNEAIATNELNIGAFLGGAAIREFVQPQLFEIAAFAKVSQDNMKAMQPKAGMYAWHLAACLLLLNHRLIGRALVVEVLSAYSQLGQTPFQGLKAIVATSTDERAVHMALCAMEAMVSYPLCEYDDLVVAGLALPKPAVHSEDQRQRPVDGGQQEEEDLPVAEDTLGHNSTSSGISSGEVTNRASSLSGYDFITGNMEPSAADDDQSTLEDEKLIDGSASFREVLGSIFRWERSTRSLRVAQASARVILSVVRAGGECVAAECAIMSAVVLNEYICTFRSVLDDEKNSALLMSEALSSATALRGLRHPGKLLDFLISSDIVVNKGFSDPPSRTMERAIREETSRRRRRRQGYNEQRPSKRGSKEADLVAKLFVQLDAECLFVLTWLTAELRDCQSVIDKLKFTISERRQDATTELESARQFVCDVLDMAGGACVQ